MKNHIYDFTQRKSGPSQLAKPNIDYALMRSFSRCEWISDWPDDVVVEVESAGAGPEDLPWWQSPGTFGSDRFRQTVERVAPDHAQFLPVKLRYDGGAVITEILGFGRYWIVNWLKLVDCLDPVASQLDLSGEYPKFQWDYIDSSLVPPNVDVFRVKYAASAVRVTSQFVGHLKDNNITGWRLMEADVVA